MKKILFLLILLTTIITQTMEQIPSGNEAIDCDNAIAGLEEAARDIIAIIGESRKRKGGEFACDHPGCAQAFSYKNVLKQHKKIHTPVEERDLNLICDYPECNYKTDKKDHLTRHQITHTKDSGIELSCDVQDCSYTTYSSENLYTHKRHKHSQFVCRFPGCSHITKFKRDLREHMKIHTSDSSSQDDIETEDEEVS